MRIEKMEGVAAGEVDAREGAAGKVSEMVRRTCQMDLLGLQERHIYLCMTSAMSMVARV